MMCSPRSGETGTTVGFSDSPRKAEKPSCHLHRKHREPAVQKDARAPSENGTYSARARGGAAVGSAFQGCKNSAFGGKACTGLLTYHYGMFLARARARPRRVI